MPIQSTRPNRTKLLIAAVLACGALVIVFAEWRSGAFSGAISSGGPTRAYFTDDDGATFFADAADRVVPSTRDGKIVVRAHVFKCGNKLAVAYLSRSTHENIEAVKQLHESAHSEKNATSTSSFPLVDFRALGANGIEVKAPGGQDWTISTSKTGRQIVAFKWPDGMSPGIEVYP